MGWNPFESDEETYVATQVMRAIKDDGLPDSAKQGTIEALFSDGNLPEYLLENAINSVAIRADRMYEYAEKNYSFGLPSGETFSNTQGRSAAQATLNELEGTPVVMEYFRYGSPNNQHIGWMRLIEQYGYDPVTNELVSLSAQKGKKVYLHDMVVVIPTSQKGTYRSGQLGQWGVPATSGYTPERPSHNGTTIVGSAKHTPIRQSSTATTEYIEVTYIVDSPTRSYSYSDGDYVSTTSYPAGTVTIQTSDVDDTASYFHAKYLVNDQIKYWMYRAKNGTYPALDALYDAPPSELGSFYPIAYFRHNKARVDQDKSSAEYKTSLKILKYIGVDFQGMVDSIHENPDIADVEQAMLMMAVPANTTNPVEQRYLFDFFDAQYYSQDTLPKISSSVNFFGFNRLNEDDLISILIQDKRSKTSLRHSGIYKRRVVGKIGKVGEYSSAYGTIAVEKTYESETDNTARLVINTLVGVPTHYYRKQISLNIYEEVQVTNLQMLYNIWGGYNVVADGITDILLIPIDRNITKLYRVSDKEVLYARSLHYVFNSRTVVEVEWYEQSWFGDILQIAAIVLTVISLGTQSWSMAIAATLTTITAVAFAIAIALQLLASYLIGQLFRLFVKVVGQDIAFLAAIIAAAYGVNGVIEAGGFQAAAPLAKDMLTIANGMVSAIGADIQAELADLIGEFSEFDKYVEEQTKLLDKANDLLKTSQVLSPFVIFGEKPEDFYKRTVHSGNIGTIGIDAIGNYVERSLTLPQLSDTLGEYSYGDS